MAKKTKTSYFCQNCGHESPKWQGKCPSCQQWNTFVEELVDKGSPADEKSSLWKDEEEKGKKKGAVKIAEVSSMPEVRFSSKDKELNRVLGGGIVPGALVLIGGEPGIGKSTLMLQVALNIPLKVLYISGEESEQQIKMRADRISKDNLDCYIYSETDTRKIFNEVKKVSPQVLVIDSIQTVQSPFIESAAGSVSQVKECTAEFMRFSKESNIPVFLVGHITKDGNLAGPKVLEHMVDTVLHFEGDRHMSYRILRTVKNRFGSTSELGIYEMRNSGLREVSNPSEILLSQRDGGDLSGIAIGAMVEGNRPLLIEIQALVTPSAYGTPQRSSTGFDAKRLNMLLAVIEKRCGFKVNFNDVFLNITGGLKVEDPAIDLAVCMSIMSSLREIEIPETTCFAAEIGLAGEVRAINRLESRIAEAEKLGFKKIVVSSFNLKGIDQSRFGINIVAVNNLSDLVELLFL